MLLAGYYTVTGASAEDADKSKDQTQKTDVAPPQAPAAALPSKFYFELDTADMTIISNGVMELPKKVADPFIAKLNAQIQQQDRIAAAAAAAYPAKK